MQYLPPNMSFQLTPHYASTLRNGQATSEALLNQSNGVSPQALRPQYNESNFIRFFRFYGMKLELIGKQLIGSCPFRECRSIKHDSPDHFFASPGQGTWDCKYCHKSGNIYTFIRQFHADALALTTSSSYDQLAQQRAGIPAWVFPQFGLAINPLNGEWLLPSYSFKTKEMTNLYAWKQKSSPDGPSMAVYSGPCMKQILYGLQNFRKDHSRPLMILEGHWDFLATYGLLYQLGILDQIDIVATCGDSFPDVDLPLLSGRDIIHHGDNDHAGESSFAKLLNQLALAAINPRSIRRMGFGATEPKGMDIRDIISGAVPTPQSGSQLQLLSQKPMGSTGITSFPQNGLQAGHQAGQQRSIPTPGDAYRNIISRYYPVQLDPAKHINAAHSPTLRQIPCTSFDDVLESLIKGKVYLPDCLKDTMAVICAVAATTSLGDKPLWSYIIGPSGSSKTTFLSFVSSSEPYCMFMSKWTGLVSGYYERGLENNSLVKLINGKCVCIEDFTPIINETEQTQARLFGELREIYGGKITNSFRNPNGLISFSDIKFNILACVTDRIRKINNTDLGERFLQTDQDTYWTREGEMITDGIDRKVIVQAAMENVLSTISDGKFDKYTEQRGVCWGFIDHIANRINNDQAWVRSKAHVLQDDPVTVEYYGYLAQWAAYARSFIERDREKQARYTQRVEFGSRLSTQLLKLSIALSLMFDEEPNTERVKGIVRKVALDTGYSSQFELMMLLAHCPYGLTPDDLVHKGVGSATTVMNRTRDTNDLGITTFTTPPHGLRGRGNQPHVFKLSTELTEIADKCGFLKKPTVA